LSANGQYGYYNELVYDTTNPFVGAALKIKRADRHIAELTYAARSLPRRQGYAFIIEQPEPRKLKILYIAQNPMPIEFTGTMGDAIHNLRSALDLIAVVLTAPPFGSGNPSHAYFPTGEDRDKFIIARKKKMKRVSAEAWRMVEELESYSGGKNALRALHDLDVLDKHKLLIPVVSSLTITSMNITLGGERITLRGLNFQPDGSGRTFSAEIACPDGVSGEDFKSDDNLDATFTIVFGPSQPLQGKPIVPTLLQFSDLIKSFIKSCEAAFYIPISGGMPTLSQLGLIQ
jgi:hypothetical protein